MRSSLSSKLTYANVMSTLAVVLAVGGGATAIALTLPKNSVHSKQIAKSAVKTSDIGKDAVTGDKVKESSLGKVPQAAHADSADSATHAGSADTASVAGALAGFNPAEVGKTQKVTGPFDSPDSLELTVAGFGRFFIDCEENSPSPADDEPDFGYSSSMPAGSIESGYYMRAPAPFSPPVTEVTVGEVSNGASATFGESPAIAVDYTAATPSGKTVTIRGGAFDNTTAAGCEGILEATVGG